MFGASHVRGAEANALFKQLAAQTGSTPRWNFHKYLVGRDGRVLASWGTTTTPDDKALVQTLEKALAAR